MNAADAVASPGTPDTVNVQPTSSLIGGVIAATYSQTGTTVTVTTPAAHGLAVGDKIFADVTTGDGADGQYTVTSVSANDFTYESASFTTSGNVNDYQCCLWRINFDWQTAEVGWCWCGQNQRDDLSPSAASVTISSSDVTLENIQLTGDAVGAPSYGVDFSGTGLKGIVLNGIVPATYLRCWYSQRK